MCPPKMVYGSSIMVTSRSYRTVVKSRSYRIVVTSRSYRIVVYGYY